MTKALGAVLLLAVTAGLGQVRDRAATPPPARAGTGSISGVVIDDLGTPVPRAVLTVWGAELQEWRGAITTDRGYFRVDGLPSGRFFVKAEKPSYITSAYGAKRPGRPGTPVVLSSRSLAADLTIRLWRGGVLTGVVRDEVGQPVPGVSVRAISVRRNPTDSMLLSSSSNGSPTNLRGEFRLYGLEPGTYLLAVRPSLDGSSITTADRIDELLRYLQRRTTTPPQSGEVRASGDRTYSYAPVYYPGTPHVDQAVTIQLASGEERGGLNVRLITLTGQTVSGEVTAGDGRPVGGVTVFLRSKTRDLETNFEVPRLDATSGPSGEFRIPNVTPGTYKLFARTHSPLDPLIKGETQWAAADVVVGGADVRLRLTLTNGLPITGRLTVEGSLPGLPSLKGLSVLFTSEWRGVTISAPIGIDGSFQARLPVEGRYSFSIGGRMPDGWTPHTAMLDGVDILDGYAEVARAGQLEVKLTDRVTEVQGRLVTQAALPVSDVFVLLYGDDQALWGRPSRRVMAVRPDIDGRYIFPAVPPGSYFIGVVTDVDPSDWLSTDFLYALAKSSVKLTVPLGARIFQDLQVGGK